VYDCVQIAGSAVKFVHCCNSSLRGQHTAMFGINSLLPWSQSSATFSEWLTLHTDSSLIDVPLHNYC
jgi:hypothetical protein